MALSKSAESVSAREDAFEMSVEATALGRMTNSRTALLKNGAWNLLGNVLPLAVALPCIPALGGLVGDARLGLITIFWLVVGYFSLFDLGIGRGLTRLLASAKPDDQESDLGADVGTGLVLVSALGLTFSLALIALPVSSDLIFPGMDAGLRSELQSALVWLGLTLPLVSVSSAFRGILEGEARFFEVNLIRAPLGALLFLSPLVAVALLGPTLPAAAFGLFVARALGLLLFISASRKWFVHRGLRFSAHRIPNLLSFGGWLTLSAIAGPLIVYADRFALTHFARPEQLALYNIPSEIGLRAMALPAAIGIALFPAVASKARDVNDGWGLALDAVRATALIMSIVVVGGIAACKPLLGAWMGVDMARIGGMVLLCLAPGAFANSIAQITYNASLAIGLSRTTATVHLLELVVYAPALILGISMFGLFGAAACWSLRAVVDAMIMTRLWELSCSKGRNEGRWEATGILLLGTAAVTTAAVILGRFF